MSMRPLPKSNMGAMGGMGFGGGGVMSHSKAAAPKRTSFAKSGGVQTIYGKAGSMGKAAGMRPGMPRRVCGNMQCRQQNECRFFMQDLESCQNYCSACWEPLKQRGKLGVALSLEQMEDLGCPGISGFKELQDQML